MEKLIFTHFPLFLSIQVYLIIFRIYVLNDILTDSLSFIFPFSLLKIGVLKIRITMEVKKVLFKIFLN